jgi:hypothetical protein
VDLEWLDFLAHDSPLSSVFAARVLLQSAPTLN